MYKGGDCIQKTRNNSRKNRVSVNLGINRSGGLIIALALMVSINIYWKKFWAKQINLYWKKFRAKQPFSEGQELEFRERHILNKEDSMVFTLEQMMEATQTFSQKLGKSTFGPVFFGKMRDGKEIAVIVLSSNSEEEIQEFFTEVHVISRVHHKNLLSLLGYCDESGKHMLIYDYMCGGCLSNRLYGQSAGLPKLNWKSRLKIAIDVAEDDSMIFTLQEMKEATQTFSQKLCESTFGPVFFGKMRDGKEIAVKVLSSNSEEEIREFFTEVHLLCRVHHKNLLSLLGYCDESGKRMLIGDYMCGGRLSDRLYGQNAGLPKLNWKSRLKIAIDVAEALQYLHVCCTPMIIHRHVKTANILLDSNLNGKLGDFGLSKMTMDRKAHIVDTVKGTYGYADPEYLSTGHVTQKNDVYSFGVVLLEIICGRNAFDRDLPSEERLLSMWVRDYVGITENPGKILEIIDKKMEGKYHMKSITIVAKVALRCLQSLSSRPGISAVVGELKEAFMYEKVKWES